MKRNLKFYLKDKLNEKELLLVPTSFDVVGDIMIFSDFPKELAKKEKMIAGVILENYRSIKTILKKTKKYSGKFRTPTLKIIGGERRKETVAKENDITIKLNVEKVYFSTRISNERKRIASLVKPNESVLVMFSGSGVYPLVIAKHSKCREVYGIEINPTGHKYGLENVEKNKMNGRVKLFVGDVNKVLPKIKQKFDRVLMPLPKSAEEYLEIALKYTKKKGMIHFYDFLHEGEFELANEKIAAACKKTGRKFKIIRTVKCGQHSHGFFRICVDFEVW